MRRGPEALAAAVMAVALGAAIGAARWLESAPRPADLPEDLEYLPTPALARRLAFGYDAMAADLMWIRTVQYFGKHLETDRRYPRLRPLLELTAGLDLHFVEGHRYGALFLWVAEDMSGTIAFLEEGYHNNPDRWELPHDLGRFYFLQMGDNANALRWWRIARSLPGAPEYIPRMIARLEARVGNVETAIELWEAMEQDPNATEYWREKAREEIKRLRDQLARGGRLP